MKRGVAVLALAVMAASCSDGSEPATTATTPAPTATGATATTATTAPPADDRVDDRNRMVDRQIEGRGVADPVVLDAMRTVPRHLFVPDEFRGQAYDDHPLPIGYGQTISQPYIVALMSEALGVAPGDRVLEIGTGSGYQAAVLGQMGMEVYTVEIIPELAARSTALLDELGFEKVTTLAADGYFGWEEHAPFDAIVVTAAPDHVPQPLVNQLATGGRMVIPVGPVGAFQTLWQFTADASGELIAENLGGVSFVPFTRSE